MWIYVCILQWREVILCPNFSTVDQVPVQRRPASQVPLTMRPSQLVLVSLVSRLIKILIKGQELYYLIELTAIFLIKKAALHM